MLVFCFYFISNQTCTMRIIYIVDWLCQGDKPRPMLSAFNGSIEHRGAESKDIGAQPSINQGCPYHKYPKSLGVDNTRILLEEDNGVLHRRDWYCFNGIMGIKPYPHHDNRGQDCQLHYHISGWNSKPHLWHTPASFSIPWLPNTTLPVSSTPSSPFDLSLHRYIKHLRRKSYLLSRKPLQCFKTWSKKSYFGNQRTDIKIVKKYQLPFVKFNI